MEAEFSLIDVLSDRPFAGNQLAGFLPTVPVDAAIDCAALTPDQACAPLVRLLNCADLWVLGP